MVRFLLFCFFLWEARNAGSASASSLATLRCLDSRKAFSPSGRAQGGQRHCLLAAQSFPGDATEEGMALDVTHTSSSRAQAVAGIELKQLWVALWREEILTSDHSVCVCVCSFSVYLQAFNLTSVSRDAAAALRWSGMSSWVWEWIPAGWSCHSGWRHSEWRVGEKPRLNITIQFADSYM